VHQRLGGQLQQKVDRVMARSVAYAFANSPDVMPYVRAHAQEMDETVTQAHINLYVNHYTKDLGPHGRGAVAYMLKKAQSLHPEIKLKEIFFVN
jgi:1,4-dihydroxy-6-naphthoate synthase